MANKKLYQIWFDEEFHVEMKQFATDNRLKVSDLIRTSLVQFMKQHNESFNNKNEPDEHEEDSIKTI